MNFSPSKFSLPTQFEKAIQNIAQKEDWKLKTKSLSEDILKLSDYFIANPDKETPWREAWAQRAYLTYFTPLNLVRTQRVMEQGLKVDFFNQLDHVVEYGSGLGAASISMQLTTAQFRDWTFIEKSTQAQKLHQTLQKELLENTNSNYRWQNEFEVHSKYPQKTLGLFSYVLTELKELPEWALELEALMILEPSTQEDSRNLLKLRQQLIENGYSIWAPCTHQNECPLLKNSKTDWCHDRIAWEIPSWFKEIEAYLPIRNNTLTTSYILARKTAPKVDMTQLARLTGDSMQEKGKNRQMICQSDVREFVVWMHKNFKKTDCPQWPRGELMMKPQNFKQVSNEVRLEEDLVPFSS